MVGFRSTREFDGKIAPQTPLAGGESFGFGKIEGECKIFSRESARQGKTPIFDERPIAHAFVQKTTDGSFETILLKWLAEFKKAYLTSRE